MWALLVSLTLGSFLSPSGAMALNSTALASRHLSNCEYEREQHIGIIGGFTPRCDANGNYLPQQCSGSTGMCWCVNVITGEEIPNTRTPPGAVPVNCYLEFYCPYGWSRFGRRCFIFVDSAKTWAEAESYCLFEVANLASVHSYQENRFLQSLTKAGGHIFPHTWLGGNDAIYDNFWMWSDGSKLNYENWIEDKSTVGRCLMMNSGFNRQWNCLACNTSLPFVCAKTI